MCIPQLKEEKIYIQCDKVLNKTLWEMDIRRIYNGDSTKYSNRNDNVSKVLSKVIEKIPNKYLKKIDKNFVFAIKKDYSNPDEETEAFNSLLIDEFSGNFNVNKSRINNLLQKYYNNYIKNQIYEINKKIKIDLENEKNEFKKRNGVECDLEYTKYLENKFVKIKQDMIDKIDTVDNLKQNVEKNFLYAYYYSLLETSKNLNYLSISGQFFELNNKVSSFMEKYNEIHQDTFSKDDIKTIEDLFIMKSNCEDINDYIDKKVEYLTNNINVSDHIKTFNDDYEIRRKLYAKKMGIKL